MEGRTIVNYLELGDYALMKLDDDSVALIKVIEGDIPLEELVGETEEVSKPKSEKKSSPKEVEPEDPPEDEDSEEEDYTWKDLEKMDYKGLSSLCEEGELETDPADYDEEEVDELRIEIAEECGIEIPEEEVEIEEDIDEEEEEDPEDDDYTWKDLEEMDYDELHDLCDEEELDTDPNDYEEGEDDDKFRRDIAEEMNIKAPPKKKPRRKK